MLTMLFMPDYNAALTLAHMKIYRLKFILKNGIFWTFVRNFMWKKIWIERKSESMAATKESQILSVLRSSKRMPSSQSSMTKSDQKSTSDDGYLYNIVNSNKLWRKLKLIGAL